MVAGPGRGPAPAVFAVPALSSADRDGPAEGRAGPAASGERLGGDGLAPVGCALVAERHFLSTRSRRAAARNRNVSGAPRRCLPAAFHRGQRFAAGGGVPVSPAQGPYCLLTPCAVG